MPTSIAAKNLPYQILFALCVSVTYLNIYELTFFVWSVTALLTIRKRYSMTLAKYLLCYAGIFAIAFITAFFKDFQVYNYVRDITYLLKPILGMLIGYQLCRSYDIKPFHTIIYTGLVLALIHIGILVFSAVIHKIVNIHELRHYGGYFGDFEFYALLFLIFNKEFKIGLSANRKWLLLIIIGFSAVLYLSRINFIQFFILLLAMKGYFRATKRALLVMSTLIIVTVVGYTIIYNMNLSRDGRGMEALLYKIKNAPIEAFKTKIDQHDYEDFNDNYRSFENIITIQQVSYEGTAAIFFGKGMGATVDVGREMWTNDMEQIRYVPTLHNGFMTVYLKAGLLGVFLNLLFLYFLGRQRKFDDPMVKQLNLMLIGTAFFLVLAHWVLLGLYLKIDNKSILIGFILGYKEMVIKRSLKQSEDEQA